MYGWMMHRVEREGEYGMWCDDVCVAFGGLGSRNLFGRHFSTSKSFYGTFLRGNNRHSILYYFVLIVQDQDKQIFHNPM